MFDVHTHLPIYMWFYCVLFCIWLYVLYALFNCVNYVFFWELGYLSRYSDSLRAGRSGERIPVGMRFSANVHTGPEAHPAHIQWVPGLSWE